MWKRKTLIALLYLVLLCSIGEAQPLMELHVPSRPTNQSTLDCNISSAEPLTIQYWAWLDPNGTELCKVNDSPPVSGPCEYVPQKQLMLNLEAVEMKITGNYTCKIFSTRGIKFVQVEVKFDPFPTPESVIGDTSSSVCGPGLAWMGLLLTLLMM